MQTEQTGARRMNSQGGRRVSKSVCSPESQGDKVYLGGPGVCFFFQSHSLVLPVQGGERQDLFCQSTMMKSERGNGRGKHQRQSLL